MKLTQMNKRLAFRKIFDKEARLPQTREEALAWANQIECDLSPENLHCDGEISASAARKKEKALMAEYKELNTLAATLKLPLGLK